MPEMVIGAVLAVVVIALLVLRVATLRSVHDGQFGPHLHDSIHELIEPYAGQQLPIGKLRDLERQAQRAFHDTLTGVGLVPTGWNLELMPDELLGPTPYVLGPNDERLTLAEFEAQLRTRRINLDAS
jgi:hypothetical protein